VLGCKACFFQVLSGTQKKTDVKTPVSAIGDEAVYIATSALNTALYVKKAFRVSNRGLWFPHRGDQGGGERVGARRARERIIQSSCVVDYGVQMILAELDPARGI
jgi:hypothetical protein